MEKENNNKNKKKPEFNLNPPKRNLTEKSRLFNNPESNENPGKSEDIGNLSEELNSIYEEIPRDINGSGVNNFRLQENRRRDSNSRGFFRRHADIFTGAVVGAGLFGVLFIGSKLENNPTEKTKTNLFKPTPIKKLFDYGFDMPSTKIGDSEYFWTKLNPSDITISDANYAGNDVFQYLPIEKQDATMVFNPSNKSISYLPKMNLEAFVNDPNVTGLTIGKDEEVSVYDFGDGIPRAFYGAKNGFVMIPNPILKQNPDGSKDYSPNQEGSCYIAVPVKINEKEILSRTANPASIGTITRND